MRHGVGPTTVLVGPCMNLFKIESLYDREMYRSVL